MWALLFKKLKLKSVIIRNYAIQTELNICLQQSYLRCLLFTHYSWTSKKRRGGVRESMFNVKWRFNALLLTPSLHSITSSPYISSISSFHDPQPQPTTCVVSSAPSSTNRLIHGGWIRSFSSSFNYYRMLWNSVVIIITTNNICCMFTRYPKKSVHGEKESSVETIIFLCKHHGNKKSSLFYDKQYCSYVAFILSRHFYFINKYSYFELIPTYNWK